MRTSHIPRTKREAVARIRAASLEQLRDWLLLVPAFAEELAAWIADTKKGDDDKLFHVPQAAVRIRQKNLELAGIPYKTSQGDADFHSLRMAVNVMLEQAGIPARIRQLCMRHSDIRLTMATYDDEIRDGDGRKAGAAFPNQKTALPAGRKQLLKRFSLSPSVGKGVVIARQGWLKFRRDAA